MIISQIKLSKIQGIQGFSRISSANIFIKFSPFGTNENVEIKAGVLEDLRLADLLLGNDLFRVGSKLKGPIAVAHFDGFHSGSPDRHTVVLC